MAQQINELFKTIQDRAFFKKLLVLRLFVLIATFNPEPGKEEYAKLDIA